MTTDVKNFLATTGMLKYNAIFHAKGFDLETDVRHMTNHDLEESLMITSPQDRAHLLYHAQQYRPSNQFSLALWLTSHHLEHYLEGFELSELTDAEAICRLKLTDMIYDELEIELPGHRRRLERAVAKLKKDQSTNESAEIPVTNGWWGKPACLPQAKFDFLCVQAALFSHHEPQKRVYVDFMVDSGSDVSTVQEATLKTLNLTLLGSVYSCGVHGGSHTNLYKARIAIGAQEMDIEIMGSNYDSIGSRVVRHFRHVIDGTRHVWLKGDYCDPLPAVLPLPPSQVSSHQLPLPALPAADVMSDNLPVSDTTPLDPQVESLLSLKRKLPSEEQLTLTKKNKLGASDSLSIEERGVSSLSETNQNVTENTSVIEKSSSIKLSKPNGSMPLSYFGPTLDTPAHPDTLSKAQTTKQDQVDNILNGRVSLKHTLPAFMRDTDDDIDHMTSLSNGHTTIHTGSDQSALHTSHTIPDMDDVVHISMDDLEASDNLQGQGHQNLELFNFHNTNRPDDIVTLTLDELEGS